jgi:hypothetical protein
MSRHSQHHQVREAVFAKIALVNGCHHFAALEPRGEWINSCVADAYGIELITYANNYTDVIGKHAQFAFEGGVLTEIRSVEGYTADQILAVKLRQTMRLSPLDRQLTPVERAAGKIGYGAHKWWHNRFHDQNSRHRPGKLALAHGEHITYLVQSFGAIELATPIWLGQLPAHTSELDADDKILAFEQRCHEFGSIARRNPSSQWKAPLLDTRPSLVATQPLTL